MSPGITTGDPRGDICSLLMQQILTSWLPECSIGAKYIAIRPSTFSAGADAACVVHTAHSRLELIASDSGR